MLTERDVRILAWIGGLGAAGAEHVVGRFAVDSATVYRRLRALVEEGLLEQRQLFYRRPGLYCATRPGLRVCRLDGLGVFRVGPTNFEHSWEVATVAAALANGLPGWQVLGEREMSWQERQRGELLGSVRVSSMEDALALHRPDLVLISPGGRVVAVEVELSVKGRARLLKICRGWGRARHLDAVYYLASRPAAAAVARAVREMHVEEYVEVLALDGTAALVTRERLLGGHGPGGHGLGGCELGGHGLGGRELGGHGPGGRELGGRELGSRELGDASLGATETGREGRVDHGSR
ncbi:MAG TPA: hypothetical protein VMU32_02200 [Solirubrobacteraceae bacterium]|nr:hypothetical protein [Solirubrobacteraceae bacterium]